MQQRLKKYGRDPESLSAVASRRITGTSVAIIATIHDYRIIPTSSLVRLVQGHEKNIQLHFQQGPVLWHKVEVPKLSHKDGQWREMDQTEQLPHRPDAFFTLNFPNDVGREPLHFFYEADRHRTNTHKYNKKLRAYFHFVVKQKLQQQFYGTKRIRAVLTETVDSAWGMKLREASKHFTVSGPKASPLFWFTT